MYSVKLPDKVAYVELREKLRLEDIVAILQCRRLWWSLATNEWQWLG